MARPALVMVAVGRRPDGAAAPEARLRRGRPWTAAVPPLLLQGTRAALQQGMPSLAAHRAGATQTWFQEGGGWEGLRGIEGARSGRK